MMSTGFTNLGMAKKLGLGFGLVLMLTALVAGIGVWSLQRTSQHFDGLKQMSSLNTALMGARLLERDYALNYDPKLVERLHGEIDALNTQVDALADITPANQPVMAQVRQALAEYRRSFDAFVDINQSKDLALEMANWSVVSVGNSLELLQTGLTEDGIWELKDSQGKQGSEFIVQAGKVNDVSRLMFQAMEEARIRLDKSRRAGEQTNTGVIDQAGQARTLTEELQAGITDPGYQTVINEVSKHIVNFNEKLQEYTDLLARQATVSTQLADNARQVVALVSQLYAAEDQAMQTQLQMNRLQIIGCSVIALLVGFVASWLITRLIVTPLRQVIGQAQRIAAGDLSGSISADRRDEVGQLMQAMQQMSDGLSHVVSGLQSGIEKLASSATALSSVTEQTNLEVSHQKEETEQVATAMNEMTATVHDVARNAEEAALAAQSADAKVINGQSVVRQSMERIERLAQSSVQASEGIEKLSVQVQSIDQVLGVIKSVAEQTNLLALNAAIEAARAGEQGRGFAVVADEVRALARRTQQSTEEIEQLVTSLRAGARASVEQIQGSGELVKLAVSDALQTENALGSIALAVSTIQQMNHQIAAAAEQQSSVAEEINRSITNIRGSADQSALAMQDNAASSVELASLGSELKGMVGHFRL